MDLKYETLCSKDTKNIIFKFQELKKMVFIAFYIRDQVLLAINCFLREEWVELELETSFIDLETSFIDLETSFMDPEGFKAPGTGARPFSLPPASNCIRSILNST